MNRSTQKGTQLLVGTCAVLFAVSAVLTVAWGGLGPGSLDPSFDDDGKVLTGFGLLDEAYGMAIQADGKIVVVGKSGLEVGTNSDLALARYNPDGSLDTSFNGDGKVTTDISGFFDRANAVVVQPDQKIVVAGETHTNATGDSRFAVVRYNVNGSLDTSFDGDGKVTTDLTEGDDIGSGLVIQPDGKLVVVGATHGLLPIDDAAGLVRYNSNGGLDSSFDSDGKLVTSFTSRLGAASGVALQPDGKIVISGTGSAQLFGDDFAAARFFSNGQPDTAFGIGGLSVTDLSHNDDSGAAVALQPDGRIVVVGSADFLPSDFALVRYNTDGSLDGAFGNGGIALTEFGLSSSRAYDAVIQQNGRIISVGYTSDSGIGDEFALARHLPNGDLDTSFGNGGKVTTSFSAGFDRAFAAELQPDGKIVAAGYSAPPAKTDFAIARYFTGLTGPSAETLYDYDNDGRSDISVFRPSTGAWYLQQTTAGFYGTSFGISTDRIAPADYDGDGKTDIAVYRPSTGIWYITNSSNGAVTYHVFGIAEDLPTPADYDGDGKADISVFRPSTGTWYRINSSDGSFAAAQFGTNGDKPAIGDFDGDGKADLSVFRPATGAWYQTYSSNGSFFGEQFGISTDKITPADYDGDGKTDIAIYRPSEGLWYVKRSATTTYVPYVFGLAEDIPTPGDFDGDGKADIGVFRPSDGTWYIVNSSNGSYTIFQFGQNGDLPTQSAFGN